MIASATGQLIVYVSENPIDDAAVASVKMAVPGAIVLADLLDPLYDSAISTREAAHTLGRIKSELESMTEVENLEFPAPYGRMEAFQTSGGTSTLPETFLGRVKELDYSFVRANETLIHSIHGFLRPLRIARTG